MNIYRLTPQRFCMFCSVVLLGAGSLFLPLWATAQDSTIVLQTAPENPPCQTKDMTDYVRKWFGLKEKPEKNTSIFFAPILGSTPSTGFIYGATIQGAFQMPECKLSAFQAVATYSSKKQLTISLKNNVYARKNSVFLSGD